jgi:hypothetical protein
MSCTERHVENGRVVERDCYTQAVATVEPQSGPGTELKRILKDWFGIEATLGCSCNAMAKRMNRLGPDWCEGPGMTEIVSAMRGEFTKRRQAKQTILPWSEFGAKVLIKLACRRARAAG